ncbi:MAG: DNA-processing protein DprA [Candidatus Omnitrophota bacterium]|jgi:DNA processing protein
MTIRKIAIADAEYPENLKNLHRPPKALYVNGTLLERDKLAVALVGSRRASYYGIEACEKLAYDLAIRGVTIVSGMAIGIDTAAHKGALKAKGRTIAVMGSGHGVIYPAQNIKLYSDIVKSGAVVTEFENEMEPLPYNFPQRNRIISGLSIGVVVVEAARNSGALITADFALEQGRDVFAVPGRISSQTSSGTHALIKDGAKLVQSAEDIMEELSGFDVLSAPEAVKKERGEAITKKTKAYVYNSLTETERKIYKTLSDEPLHVDEIMGLSGLDPAKGSKALLSLQIKDLIKELPGKQFVNKF